MACYTAYLATGETLLCKTIMANTIEKYLDAAAELSLPAKLMNPCLDIRGDLSIHINEIIKEIKRWGKFQIEENQSQNKRLNTSSTKD